MAFRQNPEEAKKWLAEFVKGHYLAKFRPVKPFAPRRRENFSESSRHIRLSGRDLEIMAGPVSFGQRRRTAC